MKDIWNKFSDFCDIIAKIIVAIMIIGLAAWAYKEYLYPYHAGEYEFYKDYYDNKHK